MNINETIELLCKEWKGFNREKLEEIFNRRSPQVSLAMLSWMRTNKLKKSLDYWNSKHNMDRLNIALMVQEGGKFDKSKQKSIVNKCSKFNRHRVMFTDKNNGTGKPRHQIVHKALHFDTPYIMTTDDDMLFPFGILESQIYVLEKYKNIAAVCSWCEPNVSGHVVRKGKILKKQLNSPIDFNVDIMGSATMMMKREIFDNNDLTPVDLDPDYFIGWGDFDFCMQLKTSGWKMAVFALKNFRPINDYGGPSEYKQFRYKAEHSKNSAKLFHEKWGIKIL